MCTCMLHVVLDLYPLSYPTHGPGAQQEPSLGYDRRGSLQWLPARVMFVLSRWHTQRRCGRWRPAAKTPACTSTARHVPTSLSSSNCSARTSPSTMLRDRPGHPLLSGAPTSRFHQISSHAARRHRARHPTNPETSPACYCTTARRPPACFQRGPTRSPAVPPSAQPQPLSPVGANQPPPRAQPRPSQLALRPLTSGCCSTVRRALSTRARSTTVRAACSTTRAVAASSRLSRGATSLRRCTGGKRSSARRAARRRRPSS